MIRVTKRYTPAKIRHVGARTLVLTLKVNNPAPLTPTVTRVLLRVALGIISTSPKYLGTNLGI